LDRFVLKASGPQGAKQEVNNIYISILTNIQPYYFVPFIRLVPLYLLGELGNFASQSHE